MFLTAKDSTISVTVGGGVVTATVTPLAGVNLCPTKVYLRQFEVPATWDGNGYDASAQPQTLLKPIAETTVSGSSSVSLSVPLDTTAGLYTTGDGCSTAVNRQFDVATGTTHLAGGPRRIPVGTVPSCHTTPPTSPSGGGSNSPSAPPSGGSATPTFPDAAGSATVATPGSFAAGDTASHPSSMWTWLLGGSAAALAGAGAIAFRRPRSARH